MQISITLNARALDELMLLTGATTAQEAVELTVAERIHKGKVAYILENFEDFGILEEEDEDAMHFSPRILFPGDTP